MSVHEKRGRYVVRWREAGRNRSQTFDREKAARDFDAQTRLRLQMGAHAPATPSTQTLDDWLGTWWETHSPGWARSTKTTRGPVLDKWVVPYIGRVRLKDLGTGAVKEWRARILRDGASNHTANNACRILSAALGAAVDDGLLPDNPCARVKRLPTTKEPVRPLTPDQVEAIRHHLPTERDRLLWASIAYAGLRTQEALALRWHDVFDRHLLICRAVVDGEEKGTKTGRHRTVRLLAPLRDDFLALAGRERVDDALVFPNREGGFLDLHNWRARVFAPAAQSAGLPDVTPYDGRHAFASLLIHAGHGLMDVAGQLGHASGETTLRHYAHVFDVRDLAVGAEPEQTIYAARSGTPGNDPVPQTFPTGHKGHLRLVA